MSGLFSRSNGVLVADCKLRQAGRAHWLGTRHCLNRISGVVHVANGEIPESHRTDTIVDVGQIVDDIPWARYSIPGLATVRQPFGALGKEAADLLMRRISGDASP